MWLRPQSFQLLEKNPYSEPRNLCLEPGNLPQLGTSEPLLGSFAWNLGICRNLTRNPWSEPRNLPEPYLEPLLETLEFPGGTFTWNPYSEPRNLTWNPCSEPRNLYLEPLLGISKPAAALLGTFARNLGTFAWNLCLEPRNLPEPYYRNPCSEPRNLPQPLLGTHTRNLGTLLGTLTRNLGTFTWNLCLEPRNLPEPYLEPLLGTSEPLLGSFAWNLGTCCNLTGNPCSEPRNLPEPLLGTLLGTSEPAGTRRDDCPKVPQGLVWLGPQSFQLLGKKERASTTKSALNQSARKNQESSSLLPQVVIDHARIRRQDVRGSGETHQHPPRHVGLQLPGLRKNVLILGSLLKRPEIGCWPYGPTTEKWCI